MIRASQLALLTLVLSTPAALVAEAAGPLSSGSAGTRVHYKSGEVPRVDLDVFEVPPKQVFETLASILERQLTLDPAIVDPLTVRLENVTVTTALKAICESLDCEIAIPEDAAAALRITALADARSRPAKENRNSERLVLEPITLSLKDASLLDVLETFGRIFEAKADFEEGIEGMVTLELANVPANEALDHLCRQHGLSWKLVERGAGAAKVEQLEIRRSVD